MSVLEKYRRTLEHHLPRSRDISLMIATIAVLVGQFVDSEDYSALGGHDEFAQARNSLGERRFDAALTGARYSGRGIEICRDECAVISRHRIRVHHPPLRALFVLVG
ncbi:hypothetical protein [Rhodococcus sp. NPDC059234]|uniref:hypothetical protein n=1 Tax=Rhodococcus sp. NPDC059234 TaxID=3346781 RepID=UPI00366CE77B